MSKAVSIKGIINGLAKKIESLIAEGEYTRAEMLVCAYIELVRYQKQTNRQKLNERDGFIVKSWVMTKIKY